MTLAIGLTPARRVKLWRDEKNLPEVGQLVHVKIIDQGSRKARRPEKAYAFKGVEGECILFTNPDTEFELVMLLSEFVGWWPCKSGSPCPDH